MKKILALFDVKMWKFILVGIVNTLVGYGIMFGLYNLAHVAVLRRQLRPHQHPQLFSQ